MEFFGDDIEDDDDEFEQSPAEESKEVENQKVQSQQSKPKPIFKEDKPVEEKKGGIGSIFGVGNKKEESAKMTATTASATKVSYVSIIRPKVFEDSRLIADAIKENKVVTFSLEFLEYEVGQRVIDFVSGAAYAMNAHLSKVTDKVLTSIPVGIDYEDIDASLGDDSKDSNFL
ncbi:cell division protein SepF [Leptotrichia sp. oral taxon 847]|nr:cell division protein SepF [Leptotrichia sp. oral taxon 847]